MPAFRLDALRMLGLVEQVQRCDDGRILVHVAFGMQVIQRIELDAPDPIKKSHVLVVDLIAINQPQVGRLCIDLLELAF